MAQVRDAGGKIIRGKPVNWTSTDSTVAAIDSLGVVRGRSPGRVELVAGGALLGLGAAAIAEIHEASDDAEHLAEVVRALPRNCERRYGA